MYGSKNVKEFYVRELHASANSTSMLLTYLLKTWLIWPWKWLYRTRMANLAKLDELMSNSFTHFHMDLFTWNDYIIPWFYSYRGMNTNILYHFPHESSNNNEHMSDSLTQIDYLLAYISCMEIWTTTLCFRWHWLIAFD